MREKLVAASRKIHELESKLVEPARAAANQMKDAGMHRGADPVLEILFQIEAAKQELEAIFKGDPENTVQAIIEMMSGKPNP